jgi:hypothetical protein
MGLLKMLMSGGDVELHPKAAQSLVSAMEKHYHQVAHYHHYFFSD